jgi:putative intracellular protease/amidase
LLLKSCPFLSVRAVQLRARRSTADGREPKLPIAGYWPEELAEPHRIFREAGLDITVATRGGVVPTADEAGFTPEMNNGSAEAGQKLRDYLASIEGELSTPKVLEQQTARDYDFIFVPGGHGPMEDLAASRIRGPCPGVRRCGRARRRGVSWSRVTAASYR